VSLIIELYINERNSKVFFGRCIATLDVIKSWPGDLCFCVLLIRYSTSRGNICLGGIVIGKRESRNVFTSSTLVGLSNE
jgi:hypothetical protein